MSDEQIDAWMEREIDKQQNPLEYE